MSDFKLIAIRPRKMSKKLSEKFLKVLTPYVIYKFYSGYEFVNENNAFDGNVTNIRCTQELSFNLYENESKPSEDDLKINISAIVGKNGSGKSSLIELLYLAIFNISKKLDVLPLKDDEHDVIKYVYGVHLEFYFKRDSFLYKVLIEDKEIRFYTQDGNYAIFLETADWANKGKAQLRQLFYTLVINYSHFALNSQNLGAWVKNIFHKNDAYQTPIVLNPFRKSGNININDEEYLTFSRVLTNLLVFSDSETIKQNPDKKSLRELSPGKTVEKITLKLNTSKTRFKNEDKSPEITAIEAKFIENKKDILDLVFEVFPIRNKPETYEETDNTFLYVAYNYLLKKIYSIRTNYLPFQRKEFNFIRIISETAFKKEQKEGKYIDSKYGILLPELKNFLIELSSNKSHITLKFRQAINYIQNFSFYINYKNKSDNIFVFKIEDLCNEIKKTSEKNKELIELIPPSFFDIDMEFKEKGNFNALSSGEKQKIYSSASLIYHLINLNSVKYVEDTKNEAKLIDFECINIVFDEVELYYHPDLQRTFIYDLLFNLNKLNIENIKGINCIFITHSPFILSDIPSENILLLDETGRPEPIESIGKTFAANMHDILQKSFFLKHGYMGEVAKAKINSAMQFLKGREKSVDGVWDKKTVKEFIAIISEPMIKMGLNDLYYKKFLKESSEIDKEIELLNQLKNKQS